MSSMRIMYILEFPYFPIFNIGDPFVSFYTI